MSSSWRTKAEAADHLRVSRWVIDRYVREGRLPKFYLAGSKTPRFKVEDLDALAAPASDEDELDEGNPPAA